MISFTYPCPHCGTEKSGFEVRTHYCTPDGINAAPERFSLLARCNGCSKSIAADIDTYSLNDPYGFKEALGSSIWTNLEEFIWPENAGFHPEPPKPDIPDSLPEPLLAKYRAAEKMFLICRSADNNDLLDLAGNAYRAALEAALALIDGGGDKNLNQRINALVKSNKLTEEMGRFAHRIRSLGNQASHSTLPFDRNELNDLRLFSKVFMLYLFTLPAMLPQAA